MTETLFEMLSYPFMVRAFVVGILVALCSALLGVSLVLKRYSMIGDGLSHVGFGAMAVAAAANAAPLAVAIPVVIVAAVLLLRISGSSRIKGDAAIALISTSSLAIGVMVISMTTGMNTDVYNYMFGSILAMSQEDVALSVTLAVVVLVLVVQVELVVLLNHIMEQIPLVHLQILVVAELVLYMVDVLHQTVVIVVVLVMVVLLMMVLVVPVVALVTMAEDLLAIRIPVLEVALVLQLLDFLMFHYYQVML